MIIKTYQPGKVQNLFDQSTDEILKGVLYFTHLEQAKPIDRLTVVEDFVVDPTPLLVTEEMVKVTLSESFSERFLRFAFIIDRFVLETFNRLSSGLFATYQSLYSFISIINIAIDVKQSEVKVRKVLKSISLPVEKKAELRTKIEQVRTLKPLFSFPKFSLPSITISRPRVSLPRINFTKFRLPIAAFCLLLSFLSIGALLFPLISAQLFASFPMTEQPLPTPTPFRYTNYYKAETEPLYPINEFRLSIPKINLESNIVDNVDPTLEGEYKDKLQYGVAHAKGSYLPPETGGPVYLFAHSTDTIFNIARFNAKFYSVRELEAGDEIQLYFNGKEYRYIVKQKFIIDPKQVDVIKNATDTDLILQTCWPPGTDWQRLIVYADRVEDNSQPQ